MTTYLFGFVAHDEPLTALRAVGDVRPQRIALGAIDAVVMASDAGDAARQASRVHADVVRELFEGGTTVLPARSGQTFANDAALAEQIPDAGGLATALARVRGMAEMASFSALPPRAPHPESDPGSDLTSDSGARRPGAAYLALVRERARVRSRAEQEIAEAAAAWIAALRQAVAPWVRAEVVRAHSSGTGVLASHLVPRGSVAAYRAAAESVPGATGGPTVVTGPLAPFSFAADASPAEAPAASSRGALPV